MATANKISAALLLIVSLQVFMLGKQFKTSYFIPALMLLPLMVIMTLEHLKSWVPERIYRFIPASLVCFLFIMFASAHRPVIRELSMSYEKQNAEKMKTYHFLKTVRENSTLILAVGGYGGPTEEYALRTSYEWAGRYKTFFHPVFEKLYPDTYMYFTWDKTIKYWGKPLTMKSITENKKPVYLYLENDASNLYQNTLEKFEFSKDSCRIDSTLIFVNEFTKEQIYRLNFSAPNNDLRQQ